MTAEPEPDHGPLDQGPSILIVDDDASAMRATGRILRAAGHTCAYAVDAGSARRVLQTLQTTLVLLDIGLPGESGLDLMRELSGLAPETAVVMMSGHNDPELAATATQLGAYGYLVKPVSRGELLMNVDSALHRRRLELETRALHRSLEAKVAARTQALEDAMRALRHSQQEIISRLARAMEHRDADTGAHIERIGTLSGRLAEHFGLAEDLTALLRLAAPMHDVGKIGIPDSILAKPGPLTAWERRQMQQHTTIGHEILAGSGIALLDVAAEIALTHHEHWDGGGYPRGLAGTDIPLTGRIVAVVDIYDALTSDRIYRPALAADIAMADVLRLAGTHLDPEVVAAFHTLVTAAGRPGYAGPASTPLMAW